jgi:uncharacterized protein
MSIFFRFFCNFPTNFDLLCGLIVRNWQDISENRGKPMANQSLDWNDKVADVRSKGVLGMQLYAIFTEPAGDMQAVLDTMGPHLGYQKELEASGVMFAAGPFADDEEQEWSGAGMVIVRAENVQAARRIAEADPMHQCGARTFSIRPWLLNEGSLTVTVSYSDGGRKIS